jgi:hypothetical protein
MFPKQRVLFRISNIHSGSYTTADPCKMPVPIGIPIGCNVRVACRSDLADRNAYQNIPISVSNTTFRPAPLLRLSAVCVKNNFQAYLKIHRGRPKHGSSSFRYSPCAGHKYLYTVMSCTVGFMSIRPPDLIYTWTCH